MIAANRHSPIDPRLGELQRPAWSVWAGQEAETVALFPRMLYTSAQRMGSETGQKGATPCESVQDGKKKDRRRKPLELAGLSDAFEPMRH